MISSIAKFFSRSALRKYLATLLLISTFVLLLLMLDTPILEHFLIVNKPLSHADALVVMAGEASIRVPAAAQLYKEGKADSIVLTNDGIFSAWSSEKQRNLYQVEWAEDDLLKMGVPKKAIVKLPYSSSGTFYDAVNARTYILNKGIRSIIIVTSDYHTRRSLWVFDKVLRGYPIAVGVYPIRSQVVALSYSKKNVSLLCEMVKYVYYNIKYCKVPPQSKMDFQAA